MNDLQFASVWERVADQQPTHTALVCGDEVVTWRDYDDRAARIAGFLRQRGLGADSKVGIYMHNRNEYLEAQFGAFKLRGASVNVNYRYRADELVYLLEDSDAQAVFFQGCYAERIAEIRDRLPRVTTYVQIADGEAPLLDGAFDYEQVIADSEPMPRIERSGDDVYMLYTGGTTGMPKGVMYGHGQLIPMMMTRVAARAGVDVPTCLDEVPPALEAMREAGFDPVALAPCPLMHGTGMWIGALMPLLVGGSTVTLGVAGLDPHLIWSEVQRNRCTHIAIVGDAFAKPMLAALDEAADRGCPYDLSSLQSIRSSGVMWSAEVKQGLLRHRDMMLVDSMSSSEGRMGESVATREHSPGTAKFELNEGVKVFTDDDREVRPGSGERGRLATSGLVPLGYYGDPEKSEKTFREVDGVRYSFPGDYATIEADGSITLLGRGSNCINTAGEKVYPEEVEEALKRHPQVYDCLVVGMADEKFGQRIVAVASAEQGAALDARALIDFTRQHLAGYKLPKQVVFVDEVRRAANGKADYVWARAQAEAALP